MSAADYARMRWKNKGYNKYNAKRTKVDGITFDSKMESRRYIELKQLEKGGAIRDLELQPRFPFTVNDTLVCTYVADFRYWDVERDQEVIEDVKGKITREYRIKAKLMKALYGIEVQEVTA